MVWVKLDRWITDKQSCHGEKNIINSDEHTFHLDGVTKLLRHKTELVSETRGFY